MYPTLAHIARDVCAVPASSVPCERLFSAGAEIATKRRSRLGSDRFEELQVMKHAWNPMLIDRARVNSNSVEVEDISLEDFKELLQRDEELMQSSSSDIIMM